MAFLKPPKKKKKYQKFGTIQVKNICRNFYLHLEKTDNIKIIGLEQKLKDFCKEEFKQ